MYAISISLFFKNVRRILFTTFFLFLTLEAIFYFSGAPQGASRYVERIIIQQKLNSQKPQDQVRVFTYGESTMYGAHYGVVSSPSSWLQAYLKDYLPDQNIKVVKFARPGCGSHFIYETFRQTLAYKPDIAIFYLGHNAFLPGNRKDQVEAEESGFNAHLNQLIQKSHFVSAVYRCVIRAQMWLKKNRSNRALRSNPIESFPLGVKAEDVITKEEPAYWENIEYSKQNIWKILTLAKEHGVHVLFLKPVCNLKDFSPSYSVHLEGLSPRDLAQWDKWYAMGKFEQNEGHLENARKFYERAYKIDPAYADLSFRLGEIYLEKGHFKQAKRFFENARDHDAVISRATIDILKIFEELKETEGLQLVDTEQVLSSEVKGGILGEPIIEDNVHFSVRGHFLVGHAVAREMAERNWIAPKGDWQFDRERSYEEIATQMGINQELLISAYLESLVYFGSRLENRIRFAQKVLELDPSNSEALRHLAWAYWLNGRYARALEVYKALEQVDPDQLSEVFKSRPKIKRAYRNVRMPPTPVSIY